MELGMSRFCWLVLFLFLFYFIISAKVGGREESSQSVSDLTDRRCRTLKAISGWDGIGWDRMVFDWLSYTLWHQEHRSRAMLIRSLKWSDGLKALKSRLSSWRLARWNIMLCQRKPSWLVQKFLSSKSDRGGNLLPCNFLSFSNNLAVWYWILSNTATLYRERTCFRRFFASKLPPFYLWSQNRE